MLQKKITFCYAGEVVLKSVKLHDAFVTYDNVL